MYSTSEFMHRLFNLGNNRIAKEANRIPTAPIQRQQAG